MSSDVGCLQLDNPTATYVNPQAPGTGGFYGIWRHLALRFTYGSPEEGIESELELYSDGRSLCGITFAADPELVPQCALLLNDAIDTASICHPNFRYAHLP
jgi:hypothetical protein